MIDYDFWVNVLAASIALSAPLLWVAQGELISERAGVINIGIEGMMLTGALAGVLGTHYSDSIIVGLLVAMLGGLFIAVLHGITVLFFRGDQIVSGVVLNIFALGLTSFLLTQLFRGAGSARVVGRFPEIEIPLLSDIPSVGTILFEHTILTYLGFLAVPAVAFLLFRTPWGLRVRAVGEAPEAAAAQAVNVIRMRWLALSLTGVMAGVGGAALSLGTLGFFAENMTAGRGFIALAAVIFGRWKPMGVTLAVLLFSFADALQIRVQAVGVLDVPHQFLLMVPYAVTVLALALFLQRMRPPAALAVPYQGA